MRTKLLFKQLFFPLILCYFFFVFSGSQFSDFYIGLTLFCYQPYPRNNNFARRLSLGLSVLEALTSLLDCVSAQSGEKHFA